MNKTNTIIEQRKEKLLEIQKKGIDLFPNDFNVVHDIIDIRKHIDANPDSIDDSGPVFVTAGRMMAINSFGKSAFIRFRDRTGQMQAYVRKDKVGAETYDLFKKLDIGDFIGLEGWVFKTKTGEWTILATALKLLSKALRPLPEKFHGLKDPEKRYRQRYIDLLMNADVRDIFVKRSRIIESVRSYLLKRDFLEVETPMMQPLPGGAEAEPFVTHHNALGIDLFLRIAPELYLKRLVVAGFERVFEINRNFRNEGVSTRHNPEFTMLEFYQAYSTYEDLMDLTEEMFSNIALYVTGATKIEYQGNIIDFSGKWRRITLFKALEEIGGIDPDILKNRERLTEYAHSKGITISKAGSIGKIITKLFDVLVEPQLIQPTFITGYPVEISPLARKNDKNRDITDRFELFIAGYEIANGFSELNDPEDQKNRFMQQVAEREAGDQEAHHMDSDYIEALEYGMPPTAGEGIGIDRLTMLLTDSPSIREVILFPHMKPL
ncbi:lysyl-tRNA synthetase, class II [Desulfosarcina sp. BuS5]|uniref:lysine--tRNA ligase n=1 Tax=Desulfosarcina sp. BuS5 TaxID=933262 RepID=UPI000481796B|nr:lysine--tRNA ligase [Desulfosarcina sp. BuS5]WDN90112.1 lysyl-tRNA synthetase, class II [Desulfosarcina sp. BuS5]